MINSLVDAEAMSKMNGNNSNGVCVCLCVRAHTYFCFLAETYNSTDYMGCNF